MRTIFFDLFETLVTHHDPDWSPPPQTIAERLGVEDSVFHDLWKVSDEAWQLGRVAGYADALSQVCVAAGREPDVDMLSRLAQEYRAMTANVFAGIEPEIVTMLAALKQSGFRLGIITNAGDLDTEPWLDCAIAPYFDDFVASHAVGLLKRDKHIFELACERLDTLPADAVFVGDGGGNELHGATQAGLTSLWATWFLDRWPRGIRPSDFPGGEWRQRPVEGDPPYERLAHPADLTGRMTP